MNEATYFEENLKPRLEKLAYKLSKPFCYSCYLEVHGSHCSKCGSDDNMRLLDGVGCDWGVSFIVEHLIETSLTPVDTEAEFEESISECYPETTTIGWIEIDTVTAIRQLDPISWDLAKSEWIDSQVQDGEFVNFDNGNTYYRVRDIEDYLENAEGTLA